jgi:hypothetical protein
MVVVGQPTSDVPPSYPYTRYWHGYNVVAAYGLQAFELRRLRVALIVFVWAAIGSLALAAFRSGPRARRTALAIALTAAFLWAVPYFAPNLSHAPGDAVLLVGLTGMAAWPRMARRPAAIAPYAAAFGAAVVFLDMLTGQLPVAAGWLIALTIAAARDQERPGSVPASIVVLTAAGAFLLGAVMTVGGKQLLAWVLLEPGVGGQFVGHLAYYMSIPDFEAGWPGILEPFGRLVRRSSTLTWGNALASYALLAATAAAWASVARRGWRDRHTSGGRDRLMMLSAALIPVAWVVALPMHTYIHAAFMVRMLVVPIAIAPVALWWPTSPHILSELQQRAPAAV